MEDEERSGDGEENHTLEKIQTPEKKKYKEQAYRTIWESEKKFSKWLTKASDGKHAYCRVCDVNILPRMASLKQHNDTSKHQRNLENFSYLCKDVEIIKGGKFEDKIIFLVKEYKQLYDGKTHDKKLIAKIWKDIAEELDTTDVEARKKWFSLRKNYIQIKRRLVGKSETSTWPLYDSMRFLDKHLKPALKDCLPDPKLNKTNRINDEEIYSADEIACSPNHETSTSSHHDDALEVRGGPPSKMYHYAPYQVQEEDADFLFFRSLLPTVKKLGPVENLEFREEIIQILKRRLRQQQQSNSYSFAPTANSVAVCYDNHHQTEAVPAQTQTNRSSDGIYMFPQDKCCYNQG